MSVTKNKINDQLLLQMIEEGHEQKTIAEHMGVSRAAICKRLALLRKRQACSAALDILPEKQQRFVTEVALNGVSQTEAARRSFDCTDESAKTIGHRLMNDENVSQAIADILAIEGITRRSLAKTLHRHVSNTAEPGISLRATELSFRLLGELVTVNKNLNVNLSVDPVDLSKYR